METDPEYVGPAVAPVGGRREAARGSGRATGSGSGHTPAPRPGTASGPVSASGSARLPGVGAAAGDQGAAPGAGVPGADAPGADAPEGDTSVWGWLRHLADGDRLAALDDDALLDDLRVLEEVGRLVDAGRMFAAGLVAQRSRATSEQNLCTRGGFTTAEDMIAQVTGTSTRQARERIRRAEPLQHPTPPTPGAAGISNRNGHDDVGPVTGGVAPFPLLRLALRGGLISPETADVITTALGPAQGLDLSPTRVAQAECALLVAALGADAITTHAPLFGQWATEVLTEAQRSHTEVRGMPLIQLRRLARSWNRVLTQEGTPSHRQADAHGTRGRQEARRSLTIHPPRDGTRRVEGELLPDAAAQLERLLDAYLNPRTDTSSTGSSTDNGVDTSCGSDARRGVGTRGSGGLDPRTPRQKRHDALAGILTQAAGMPSMPLMGGAAPTLVITTTLEQLRHPQGVAFLQGSHHEADGDVDITVGHHTGCVGAVQKILLDPGGRILELGTPQRTFTTHQRRAIATRDGGCVIPGCDVPATWCEVHHVHEWQHGGPTHTDNGVTLCWHHHRNLERLGWDIHVRDGTPWVRPPSTVDPHRRWHPAQASLHLSFDQHTLRHPDTSGETLTGPDGTVPPDAHPAAMRGTPTTSRRPSPGVNGTGPPTPSRRRDPDVDRRSVPTITGTAPSTGEDPPPQQCRGPGPPDAGELRAPPHLQEHLFALNG